MTLLKKLTCIICPLGCNLEINEDKGELKILGNKCERGIKYALEEIKNPKRIVTTTVRIKGGIYPVIPVKTSLPIPKDYIFPLLEKLSEIEISAPIPIEYKVLENIFNLGIDVVTTRSMPKKED
jgi:CxxC motif-containing protein